MASPIDIRPVQDGIIELHLASEPNAWTETFCQAMSEALERLATDDGLRVLLLTGGPSVFSSGATFETLDSLTDESPSAPLRALRFPRQLLEFPVPVVAAMSGHAVGGGLAFALYADVAIAAAESRYGCTFASMGFTPCLGVTSLLPLTTGHQLASEMLLTARTYRGRELADTGLFRHVVPKAAVAELSLDVARRMAEQPRHVLQLLRQTLTEKRLQAFLAQEEREYAMFDASIRHPETRILMADRYHR